MDSPKFDPDARSRSQSPSRSPRTAAPPAQVHFSPPRGSSSRRPRSDEELSEEEEEEHCAICLSPVLKQATVSPCLHSQFCFQCIRAWSDQSRKCPLCLGLIDHLRLDVRSSTDYTIFRLLPLREAILPPDHIVPVLPGPSLVPLPDSSLPRHPAPPRHTLYGRNPTLDRPSERERAEERALERRRYVYQQGLFAKHVPSNRYTRFRPVGVEQFVKDAGLRSRVTMFCRRELQVFPSVDIPFLTTYLLSILQQLELRSNSALRLLSDFISPPERAVHFAHELETFARSPFTSLEGYDRFVQYGRPEKEVSLIREVRAPAGPDRGASGREDRPTARRNGKDREGEREREGDWRERDSFAPPSQSRRSSHGERERRPTYRDERRQTFPAYREPSPGGRGDESRREEDRRRRRYLDRSRSRSRSTSRSPSPTSHERQDRRPSEGASRPSLGTSTHSAPAQLAIFSRATASLVPLPPPFESSSTSPPLSKISAPSDKKALLQQRLVAEYRHSLSSKTPSPAVPDGKGASLRARLKMRLELEKIERSKEVRLRAARLDFARTAPLADEGPGAQPWEAAQEVAGIRGPTNVWPAPDLDIGSSGDVGTAVDGAHAYTSELRQLLLDRLAEETSLAPAQAYDYRPEEQSLTIEPVADEGLGKEERLKLALKRRLAAAKAVRDKPVVLGAGAKEAEVREREREMSERAAELRERLVKRRRERESLA